MPFCSLPRVINSWWLRQPHQLLRLVKSKRQPTDASSSISHTFRPLTYLFITSWVWGWASSKLLRVSGQIPTVKVHSATFGSRLRVWVMKKGNAPDNICLELIKRVVPCLICFVVGVVIRFVQHSVHINCTKCCTYCMVLEPHQHTGF